MRRLRRRFGRARRRRVFAIVSGGYYNSHRTSAKAIEEAQYLERRGYEPYVYEYDEERPEIHRRIIYGPGKGQIAPPYKRES